MQNAILEFWFGDGGDAASVAAARSALWWGKSDDSDEEIRRRFGDWVERAARGELDEWLATPRGRLALIILLDQFSRNIHRGRPASFASDAQALRWAKEGIETGVERQLRPIERVFFYLPLEHSEQLADQRHCVQLYRQLLDEVAPGEKPLFATYLDFAERHLAIIERFGRFPHRNAILGRESTAEERAFLQTPGSSF
jgi:uncharacterized protein (DUF924 family)